MGDCENAIPAVRRDDAGQNEATNCCLQEVAETPQNQTAQAIGELEGIGRVRLAADAAPHQLDE